MQDISLFDAMYTQRAIRRYKTDPVPKEAIDKVIEAATKAPSGGNTQPWCFMVITDPAMRAKVSQVYREHWLSMRGAEPRPGETAPYRNARYLAQHMHEVPVLILVCIDHVKAGATMAPGETAVRGRFASYIWPAVQNLMLAARGLGLGTCLTTSHLAKEKEIKALLSIPDHVETVALLPLGYPQGHFGPTDRQPAAEVTFYNRWGSKG